MFSYENNYLAPSTAIIHFQNSFQELYPTSMVFLLSFHPCLFFTSLVALTSAIPNDIPQSLTISPEDRSLQFLDVMTPSGDTLPILQSIKLPNFGIGTVWSVAAWDKGPYPPTWLRPIDLESVNLLLDLTIAKYATRPSEDIAEYGSIGPESSPHLAHQDTRVTIKQWEPGTNKSRYWVPAAPVQNKEFAYAAQL